MNSLHFFYIIVAITVVFGHYKVINKNFVIFIIPIITFIFIYNANGIPDKRAYEIYYDSINYNLLNFPLYSGLGKSGAEFLFASLYSTLKLFLPFNFIYALYPSVLIFIYLYFFNRIFPDKKFFLVTIFFIALFFTNYIMVSSRFGTAILLIMLSIYLSRHKLFLSIILLLIAPLFHYASIGAFPFFFIYHFFSSRIISFNFLYLILLLLSFVFGFVINHYLYDITLLLGLYSDYIVNTSPISPLYFFLFYMMLFLSFIIKPRVLPSYRNILGVGTFVLTFFIPLLDFGLLVGRFLPLTALLPILLSFSHLSSFFRINLIFLLFLNILLFLIFLKITLPYNVYF